MGIKSHKEGPTGANIVKNLMRTYRKVKRSYGLASGNKKNTVAISAIISAISEK